MKLKDSPILQPPPFRETPASYLLPRPRSRLWSIRMHPLLRPYFRLAFATLTLNLAYFIGNTSWTLGHILTLILLNFGVGILIRQQESVNLLFKIATSIPHHWPLSIRWAAGKIYHFGGIHIGGYLSGFLWYAYLTYGLSTRPDQFLPLPVEALPLMNVHLLVLALVMLVALPKFRHAQHNVFEIVARFGNWISLGLFGSLHLAIHYEAHQGRFNWSAFLADPFTWAILLLIGLTCLPWTRLRKVKVDINTPSSHVAISKFDYGVKPFAGSSTDLSRNPLFEWHSFANIPSPNQSGYRLTISRAGDWTGDLIDQKPKEIWVKGIPAAGVGNIEKLFKRVIWVATGSGIGPCLPHLLSGEVPSRLVWSTRSPRKTYGDQLVDEILAVQPQAQIWDTSMQGKPDLVQLVYQTYRSFDAEAVICISNQKLTFRLNYELERRGIPSFGAIWDS